MKKLLSLAAVLAIVIAAFSFSKVKDVPVCILNEEQTDCYIDFKQEGPFQEFIYTEWDGTVKECSDATPTDCNDETFLIGN